MRRTGRRADALSILLNHATKLEHAKVSLLVEKQRLVLRMAELAVESNRIASEMVQLKARLGAIDGRLTEQGSREG